MFRRRRDREEDLESVDEQTETDATVETAAPSESGSPPVVGTGPWDAADAADDKPRVDLGALMVAVPERMDLRLDVQEQTVVAATFVDGRSTLQVHAFAAPKTSGIWDEVREEIGKSIRGSGGSVTEATGPFGAELAARVPAEGPNAPPGLHPIRFVGVDGPRWFLRGLIAGPAATDPAQAHRLEQAFRDIVVVRGGEAMAPRELLPLRVPREATAAQPPEEESARPGLEMLERGPEITETR